MSGSNSMIRAALILLLLSSCGNLPITYIQNFSSVNSVVFGFPDQEITQELYDEYEYSFIKVRFGRGPISIMILAYVDDGVYQWSGVDDVTLYTLNGRVIKTTGLQTDFEIPDPKPRSHGEAGTIYESITSLVPTFITQHSRPRYPNLPSPLLDLAPGLMPLGLMKKPQYRSLIGSNLIITFVV